MEEITVSGLADDDARPVLIEWTLTLWEGTSEHAIGNELLKFAVGLTGSGWADEMPIIARLADALSGVVEYEDDDEDTASN